jgi:hypothetical protein
MNEYEGIATTPFPPAALSVDEKSPSHSPARITTRKSAYVLLTIDLVSGHQLV